MPSSPANPGKAQLHEKQAASKVGDGKRIALGTSFPFRRSKTIIPFEDSISTSQETQTQCSEQKKLLGPIFIILLGSGSLGECSQHALPEKRAPCARDGTLCPREPRASHPVDSVPSRHRSSLGRRSLSFTAVPCVGCSRP